MVPIRYDGETAIFTTDQVDILGDPDYYGFTKYLVIEGNPTYQIGIDHWSHSILKKKHRYSRVLRFKGVLKSLFGDTKIKPESIAEIVGLYANMKTDKPYEEVRRIVKSFGLQKVYAQIPAIVYKVYKIRLIELPPNLATNSSATMQSIIDRFIVFENLFYQLGKQDRKYFPNLKFTALRIMKGMGIENKHIPVLRTKRKIKALDLFFTKMEALFESTYVNKVI